MTVSGYQAFFAKTPDLDKSVKGWLPISPEETCHSFMPQAVELRRIPEMCPVYWLLQLCSKLLRRAHLESLRIELALHV